MQINPGGRHVVAKIKVERSQQTIGKCDLASDAALKSF
jgi:hypothetical protein